MSKHTRGPWKVGHTETQRLITSPTGVICEMWDDGERDANGRLIAAAPEMYLHLKTLKLFAEEHVDRDNQREGLATVDTLIAKIDGEETKA